MIYVDYAKRRYEAAIKEIERLEQSEFPYAHISDALLQLKKLFLGQLAQLNKLTAKSTPLIAKTLLPKQKYGCIAYRHCRRRAELSLMNCFARFPANIE